MHVSVSQDRGHDVDAVLARLGLGCLITTPGARTWPGRNESWSGPTDEGFRVFVKRFAGPREEAGQRMARSLAFERLVSGRLPGMAPRGLGWDEPGGVLVTEQVDDADRGCDLAAAGEFGTDLAFRVGRLVGALHGLAVTEPLPGGRRPVLPSSAFLRGLPLSVFAAASAGELKAWRLMQRDEELAEAVDRLLAREERAPQVPAHCDLRLDQFLLSGGRLYLTDWEEFRLADAARDVGSFAGEWLYRAATGWADRVAPDEPPSHEVILRYCADGIDRVRPVIAAFWSGYTRARPGHDPELPARAAAFAGWHLLDRMLAAARGAVRLGAIYRAAAGVGRTALRAPARSAATIGLGGCA